MISLNNWLLQPWQKELQSAITGNEAFTSLWRNIVPLFFVELCEFRDFAAWKARWIPCQNILMGYKPGLWLGPSKTFILFCLSHSEVNLLVCFRSLRWWELVSQTFRPQTDGLTFFSRIFWESNMHASFNYSKPQSSREKKTLSPHQFWNWLLWCLQVEMATSWFHLNGKPYY